MKMFPSTISLGKNQLYFLAIGYTHFMSIILEKSIDDFNDLLDTSNSL